MDYAKFCFLRFVHSLKYKFCGAMLEICCEDKSEVLVLKVSDLEVTVDLNGKKKKE